MKFRIWHFQRFSCEQRVDSTITLTMTVLVQSRGDGGGGGGGGAGGASAPPKYLGGHRPPNSKQLATIN